MREIGLRLHGSVLCRRRLLRRGRLLLRRLQMQQLLQQAGRCLSMHLVVLLAKDLLCPERMLRRRGLQVREMRLLGGELLQVLSRTSK